MHNCIRIFSPDTSAGLSQLRRIAYFTSTDLPHPYRFHSTPHPTISDSSHSQPRPRLTRQRLFHFLPPATFLIPTHPPFGLGYHLSLSHTHDHVITESAQLII